MVKRAILPSGTVRRRSTPLFTNGYGTMSRLRCPRCETVVRIQDDGRAAVRCSSCGKRILLDDEPDRDESDHREERGVRSAVRSRPSRERKLPPKKKTRGLWFLPPVTVLPP